jgi:hypothetical protein
MACANLSHRPSRALATPLHPRQAHQQRRSSSSCAQSLSPCSSPSQRRLMHLTRRTSGASRRWHLAHRCDNEMLEPAQWRCSNGRCSRWSMCSECSTLTASCSGCMWLLQTFWVTETRTLSEADRTGLLVRGNLRDERTKIFAHVQEKVSPGYCSSLARRCLQHMHQLSKGCQHTHARHGWCVHVS